MNVAIGQSALRGAGAPSTRSMAGGNGSDGAGAGPAARAPGPEGRVLWSQSEAARLNEEITSKTSGRDIIELYGRGGGKDWSILNVVTAFHRIAKALDGPRVCHHAHVSALIEHIRDHARYCSAQ
mmetsp:Transcript_110600/g.312902  ORF Transcript_110600/g.312902 Transcript_110600/m.312902 type:complete len:125 (-) Transcript_110600:45-419(-)